MKGSRQRSTRMLLYLPVDRLIHMTIQTATLTGTDRGTKTFLAVVIYMNAFVGHKKIPMHGRIRAVAARLNTWEVKLWYNRTGS